MPNSLKGVLLLLLPTILLALACGGSGSVSPDLPNTDAPATPTPEPLPTSTPRPAPGQPTLTIYNSTDQEICDVAIGPSTSSEWGNNILSNPLSPGTRVVYADFGAELHDFLAVTCEDNRFYERYRIPIGERDVIWRIGESVTWGDDSPIMIVERPTGPYLEIVNTSEWTLCGIEIDRSSSPEETWYGNRLSENLPPGDSFYFIPPDADLYDILAYDCSGNYVQEQYFIYLDETVVVTWELGSPPRSIEAFPRPTSGPEYTPIFETTNCPNTVPTDLDVDCGFLFVPENRSIPGDLTVALAVAIVRSPANFVHPEPLVILTGGPGQDALSFVDEAALTYYPGYDIIYIDQRGTGRSSPSLNCPEMEPDTPESNALSEADDPARICHDRLVAEGIDLAAYNTIENAADIDDLRRALGYRQVNLFGTSYGTRLALAVIKYHPAGVRSAILDSVYPPNIDIALEDSLNGLRAFKLLTSACASDPACSEAFPDLSQVLLSTIAQLNEAPYDDGELYVTGNDLAAAVYQGMYEYPLIPYLPRMIYEVSADNFEVYQIVREYSSALGRPDLSAHANLSDSEGMFNSVMCRDDYSFSNFLEAQALAMESLPPELLDSLWGSTEATFRVCGFWDVGRAPATENEAVESAIPTLILTGQFDPATPPAWGELAAETLSHAHYFGFPNYGHAVSTSSECADRIINQFLSDPTRSPNGNCTRQIPPIVFSQLNWFIDLEY